MNTEAHLALLQEHDSRLTGNAEGALAAIEAGTNQIVHYFGDEWVDEYLAAVIPKAIPDAVEKKKDSVQVLSTFQAVAIMLHSAGIHSTGAKFAEAMDLIISN